MEPIRGNSGTTWKSTETHEGKVDTHAFLLLHLTPKDQGDPQKALESFAVSLPTHLAPCSHILQIRKELVGDYLVIDVTTDKNVC